MSWFRYSSGRSLSRNLGAEQQTQLAEREVVAARRQRHERPSGKRAAAALARPARASISGVTGARPTQVKWRRRRLELRLDCSSSALLFQVGSQSDARRGARAAERRNNETTAESPFVRWHLARLETLVPRAAFIWRALACQVRGSGCRGGGPKSPAAQLDRRRAATRVHRRAGARWRGARNRARRLVPRTRSFDHPMK